MRDWLIKILGPNWQTTLFGIGAAVSAAVYDASVSGTLHKSTIVGVIFTAAWAFYTKNKNVTGGSVPQTLEAASRAEPVAPKAALAAEKFNATASASRPASHYPSKPR